MSLVIQSVLGALDLPTDDYKQRLEYGTAKAIVFQHATRLIRCIVDCQLYLEDAIATRSALMLARSLGAQVWDDSPLHMKQLEAVGLVYVRKLVAAGITSVEDLENTEAHRIESSLSRNPPFGTDLQAKAKAFPKLRVSLKKMGEPVIKKGEHVAVKVKAEIGFLNDKVPETFQRKPVYVCLLAETSDGLKVHFARISAKKLNNGQDVLFSANLTSASQSIRAYVMCDEIAGTMRHAILEPGIPPLAFPHQKPDANANQQKVSLANAPNTAKRHAAAGNARGNTDSDSDEFGNLGLDDDDLAGAEAGGFVDIDDFEDHGKERGQPKQQKRKTSNNAPLEESREPQQLANGKWACNHRCGDKSACKHLCCREGIDKKPKAPKAKRTKNETETDAGPKQTQLSMSVAKKSNASAPAVPAKDKKATSIYRKTDDSREARDLNRLHNSVKTKTPNVPALPRGGTSTGPGDRNRKGGNPRLSFLEAARDTVDDADEYGFDTWSSNDLPSFGDLAGTQPAARMSPLKDDNPFDLAGPDEFDDMDMDMGADQHSLAEGSGDGHVDFSSFTEDNNSGQHDEWTMKDLDDVLDAQAPITPQQAENDDGTVPNKKSGHLFVGYSSESTAKIFGMDRGGYAGRRRSLTDEAATGDDNPPKRRAGTASRARPHSIQQSQERVLRRQTTLTGNHSPRRVTETVTPAQEPNEDDELKVWFEAEFGTEHFNLVP